MLSPSPVLRTVTTPAPVINLVATIGAMCQLVLSITLMDSTFLGLTVKALSMSAWESVAWSDELNSLERLL